MKKIAMLVLSLVLLLAGCAAPVQDDPNVGTTGDAQPYYPPEPVPVVLPIAERIDGAVKVTVHGGLLGDDTEVLTDAQKADGFIDAVRNEDDSVTYTISEDKYDAYVERLRSNHYNTILYMGVNADAVTDIKCTDDLSAIDIYVIRNEYVQSTAGEIVFGVGLNAMHGQVYNIDAPGTCVITVYDEYNEIVEQVTYPDELVLYPD